MFWKSLSARIVYRERRRRRGTLPPARRASDRPIAMACFLLVTFLPERPLFNVPRLRSRITFLTFFCAVLPYFAMLQAPLTPTVGSPIDDRGCRNTQLFDAARPGIQFRLEARLALLMPPEWRSGFVAHERSDRKLLESRRKGVVPCAAVQRRTARREKLREVSIPRRSRPARRNNDPRRRPRVARRTARRDRRGAGDKSTAPRYPRGRVPAHSPDRPVR